MRAVSIILTDCNFDSGIESLGFMKGIDDHHNHRSIMFFSSIVTNEDHRLRNFYQQSITANIICVTAIHIKSYLFAPSKQRICSSCLCVDEWILPTTWEARIFSSSWLSQYQILVESLSHLLQPVSLWVVLDSLTKTSLFYLYFIPILLLSYLF